MLYLAGDWILQNVISGQGGIKYELGGLNLNNSGAICYINSTLQAYFTSRHSPTGCWIMFSTKCFTSRSWTSEFIASFAWCSMCSRYAKNIFVRVVMRRPWRLRSVREMKPFVYAPERERIWVLVITGPWYRKELFGGLRTIHRIVCRWNKRNHECSEYWG